MEPSNHDVITDRKNLSWYMEMSDHDVIIESWEPFLTHGEKKFYDSFLQGIFRKYFSSFLRVVCKSLLLVIL